MGRFGAGTLFGIGDIIDSICHNQNFFAMHPGARKIVCFHTQLLLLLALGASLSPAFAATQEEQLQEHAEDELPVAEAEKKPAAKPRVTLDGMLTFQYINEDNDDLGTAARDNQDSKSVQGRVMLGAYITDMIYSYLDLRALKISGDTGAQDDTGQSTSNEDFAEMRQAYLRFDKILGFAPLNLQIGRQRISEPRNLWWNRDFDAVRFNYKSDAFKGFFGVGQNLASYRTRDGDFQEDDEDRLRVFAEGSWQWKEKQFVDARLLYENDYSGSESPGVQVRANDFDDEDAELVWAGTRLWGQAKSFIGTNAMDYRLDVLAVAGDETTLALGPGGSPDFRAVTANTNRDVLGWAMDAAVDVPLGSSEHGPQLTMGYAFGSGDDDPTDGTDGAFRQSGLQGNASRMGVSSGYVRNYGEVLRPELSNLHVLTGGIGVPVGDASDVNLFAHYYRLDENATALRNSAIGAPLNGTDKSLGFAADAVVNVNLMKEFGMKPGTVDRALWRMSLGSFFAGEAYGAAEDEESFRAFTELQLRF